MLVKRGDDAGLASHALIYVSGAANPDIVMQGDYECPDCKRGDRTPVLAIGLRLPGSPPR